MKAFIVPKGSRGVEALRMTERPDPSPRPGQILVRLRAASLNHRDQAVVSGTYFGSAVGHDTIPLSDGAGEVIAVGEGVSKASVGDRVVGTFFQTPSGGSVFAEPVPLGSPLDGVLAERIVMYENGVVPIPDDYSYEEAATLPCAALTAWNALFEAGTPIRPGDTVLVQGTGGVASFALLFAKAAGARVVVTSSSEEKLETARGLGAWRGINYVSAPEWNEAVMEATEGRGVACVVELGGTTSLARSYRSIGRGGKVVLIGTLGGPGGDPRPYPLLRTSGSLHGVFVGDRDMFLRMNRAIEANGIKPIVDRVFPFEEAPDAYRYQASGAFIGKVVIRISP